MFYVLNMDDQTVVARFETREEADDVCNSHPDMAYVIVRDDD